MTVLSDPNNGIAYNGYYWWKMQFGTYQGWCVGGDTAGNWWFVNASITDQQKQNAMLGIVNNYRARTHRVCYLSEIFQEGGQGAFHIDGYDYNSFYRSADGA